MCAEPLHEDAPLRFIVKNYPSYRQSFPDPIVKPESSLQPPYPEPLEVTKNEHLGLEEQLHRKGVSVVFDPSAHQLSDKNSHLPIDKAFDLWRSRNPSGDLRSFLTSKLPFDFPTIDCRVCRQRGTLGTSFSPIYIMGSEKDSKSTGLSATFISSRKNSTKNSSKYSIFERRNEDEIVGILTSNFVGSEFLLQEAKSDANLYSSDVSPDLMAVFFSTLAETTTTKGPREIRVALRTDNSRNFSILDFGKICNESPVEDIKSTRSAILLKNKAPKFNAHLNAFVLNFNKRVLKASIKNFQLIDATDSDERRIIYQFGKVGKDDFNVDFSWPFSPMEAFACALTAFDFKICCD